MKTVIGLLAVLLLASMAAGETIKCKKGVRRVQCALQPCRFAQCPNISNAVCKDDYCSTCKARWFSGKEEVTDRCYDNE